MFANALVTAGLALLGILVLGIASIALLARRDRRRAETSVEWTAPLHEIIDIVDPLDTRQPVHQIQLADAYLFEELSAHHAVRLDWQPPTFTQEWASAGETMRQLGDTQQLQAVPA